MGDHAPTSHVAERSGFHFLVLALQGQRSHMGTQGDILGQLREGQNVRVGAVVKKWDLKLD